MQFVRDAWLSLALVACTSTGSPSPEAPAPKETMNAPIEVPSDGVVVGGGETTNEEPVTTGGAGGSKTEDQTPPSDPPAPAPSSPPSSDPPVTPPAPTTPPPTPTPVALPWRGVNLAGAEFGTAIPGSEGRDYQFPTPAEVDYFTKKGMNTFRIGFKWERMQRSQNAALDAAYVARLDSIVDYATKAGAYAIIQPHNFARYNDALVGSSTVPNASFADLWKKLATRYKDNAKVMFNLVNEPHDMPTEQWVGAANAAIAAIRAAGANNVIHVPGNAWTGAHVWTSTYYGTSNAVAMKNIVDPADSVVFEVHQYLDSTSGGVSSTCVSSTIGSERLAAFVKWLRDNKKRGFVGEFAGADNATCDAALTDMLSYMTKSSDVLMGWTYWAAGPAWGSDYRFSIEPQGGQDKVRMTKLLPYLF